MAVDPARRSDELADIRRRLDNLERSPKTYNAGVVGRFRVIDVPEDPEGTEVARLGRLYDGLADTGDIGIRVRSPSLDKRLLQASRQYGLTEPHLAYPWRDPAVSKGVTSATFAAIWLCTIDRMEAMQVRIGVRIVVPAATTAEVRCSEAGGASSSTLVKVLAASTDATHVVLWAHVQGLTARDTDITVEVRRASGAGTVLVYEPEPLTFGLHQDDGPVGFGQWLP